MREHAISSFSLSCVTLLGEKLALKIITVVWNCHYCVHIFFPHLLQYMLLSRKLYFVRKTYQYCYMISPWPLSCAYSSCKAGVV
jgi:hypothetical protein